MLRKSPRYQAHLMRRDWDRRATENARHYVATGQQNWSDEEFFQSGEQELRENILNDLGNICQGRDSKSMKVLEIGCGAGRVTRALAGFFGEVYAVDISPEMVRQARLALAGYSNTYLFCNNGRDLSVIQKSPDLQIDFAYSCLVFQHIPSLRIIESYLHEVNRMLRPGGLFKFQVQGDPKCAGTRDSSWLGTAISPAEAENLAVRCGYQLRYQDGAGSQYYWLWFFKRPN